MTTDMPLRTTVSGFPSVFINSMRVKRASPDPLRCSIAVRSACEAEASAKGGQVRLNHCAGIAVFANRPFVDPDCARAQILDRGQIVRYEQDGAPAGMHVAHGPEAFLLKPGIANREHLIDQHHVGLQMGGYGKAQPQAHARGVSFHGCIEEPVHAGKVDDRIQPGIDLPLLHAQDGPVEINVFPAGEFLVKTGAHFEQGWPLGPGRACGRWSDT